MDKQAIKELMFGGIMEMMRNNKYYYSSTVAGNYNHWTNDGKAALLEYMQIMGSKLWEAEEESLNKRAKEMVINGLKGETI